MNKKLEFWAFLSLIGCLLFLTLSLTILSGGWAIVGSVMATILVVQQCFVDRFAVIGDNARGGKPCHTKNGLSL